MSDARPTGPMIHSKKPRKLAFLITELDPGGAERALFQLVTRLDRTRWQPAVFCLGGWGEIADDLTEAGIPVTCFGARKAWNLGVYPRLVRELRRWEPVLLQTFLFHANIAGRLAARRAGVPVVVSGIRVAEQRSRLRLWLDRWTDFLVDRHVCVSRATGDFSIRQGHLPAEKITVIPNGVEAALFAQAEPADLGAFGVPANCRTAIFVGRLDRQKGPNLLIDAFGRLIAQPGFDDVHLLMVGEGPMLADLKNRLSTPLLKQRVHFTGRQTNISALLKAADVFVLPSRWEGMPNALLEALAAGLPVVASDVHGIREIIEPEQTGVVVAAESPDALADGLARLLKDLCQARQMGRRGQVVVTESLSWESTAAQYEALYRQLLDG